MIRLQPVESHRERTKVTSEDIPRLSAYSGSLIPELPEGIIKLSKIRPEWLTVDQPLRIAMMAATEYLLAYVGDLAKKDIEKARMISELVEVPVIKQIRGETVYLMEKKHLSDLILESASQIGEEAGKDLARRLIHSKTVTKQGETETSPSASQTQY